MLAYRHAEGEIATSGNPQCGSKRGPLAHS